jgi:hypothetical protein
MSRPSNAPVYHIDDDITTQMSTPQHKDQQPTPHNAARRISTDQPPTTRINSGKIND